jgi:hypothetical protein
MAVVRRREVFDANCDKVGVAMENGDIVNPFHASRSLILLSLRFNRDPGTLLPFGELLEFGIINSFGERHR